MPDVNAEMATVCYVTALIVSLITFYATTTALAGKFKVVAGPYDLVNLVLLRSAT